MPLNWKQKIDAFHVNTRQFQIPDNLIEKWQDALPTPKANRVQVIVAIIVGIITAISTIVFLSKWAGSLETKYDNMNLDVNSLKDDFKKLDVKLVQQDIQDLKNDYKDLEDRVYNLNSQQVKNKD